MRSPMPCQFLAPCLILFLGSAMLAADPAKPAEREAVRLTENLMLYNAVSVGTSRRLGLLRFAASDGRG